MKEILSRVEYDEWREARDSINGSGWTEVKMEMGWESERDGDVVGVREGEGVLVVSLVNDQSRNKKGSRESRSLPLWD